MLNLILLLMILQFTSYKTSLVHGQTTLQLNNTGASPYSSLLVTTTSNLEGSLHNSVSHDLDSSATGSPGITSVAHNVDDNNLSSKGSSKTTRPTASLAKIPKRKLTRSGTAPQKEASTQSETKKVTPKSGKVLAALISKDDDKLIIKEWIVYTVVGSAGLLLVALVITIVIARSNSSGQRNTPAQHLPRDHVHLSDLPDTSHIPKTSPIPYSPPLPISSAPQMNDYSPAPQSFSVSAESVNLQIVDKQLTNKLYKRRKTSYSTPRKANFRKASQNYRRGTSNFYKPAQRRQTVDYTNTR